MARYRTQGRVCRQIQDLFIGNAGGIAGLLGAEQVERAVRDQGVQFRDCLFTPLTTLWTFLAQVLSPDGSCRQAVAKLLAFLAVSDGGQPFEPDTGPYCKARKRLPETLVAQLAKQSGMQLHRRHPVGKLLGGRRVKVVDGTTVSMPDTPANQHAYPQPAPQKPGLGFPMARLVAILSLNCAAVLALAIGPYAGKQSGELALFRALWDDLELAALEAGDVLLADRYYASYWTIAALLRRGVDSLFRQHQCRKCDFRAGRRLGKHDHLIVLRRPVKPPDWMDRLIFERMPQTLTVREVRIVVAQRGFRVASLVLVTTLLDAQLYNKQELAEAFRCRWHVELDLRSIKQTMHMSVLRCKTPAMVRKEIWMHLLAYNLVRTIMAEAAERAAIQPREISFAAALQTLNALTPYLMTAGTGDAQNLMEVLLKAIARHRVGDRPDRYEPRAAKRRAKPIALLTRPRALARKRLEKRATTKS